MHDARTTERIRHKFLALSPVMDERMRRQWAATEAAALGWGGITGVAEATGLAWNTIKAGMRELDRRAADPREPVADRIRRPGAGRKRLAETDPQLLEALEALVNPLTRGDPESPLRWTCKSTAKLADELTQQNHPVSDRTVATLLKNAGYSLQANRKTREGNQHPDRNAQFEHINAQVVAFHKQRQPVISVDTKKKELVGDFKKGTQTPKGENSKSR
jgi:transposase